MMKRAKGAKLVEIGQATGWQRDTVRGFVSILARKGREKIESSKGAGGPPRMGCAGDLEGSVNPVRTLSYSVEAIRPM